MNLFERDELPRIISPFRVALERMLIGGFTTVLENKGGIR